MLDNVIKKIADIPDKLSDGVSEILKGVAEAKLKEPEKTIEQSQKLKTLTSSSLLAMQKMEKATNALKAILRRLKFWLKQEHNALKYKLESTVTAKSFDFYARAHYGVGGWFLDSIFLIYLIL